MKTSGRSEEREHGQKGPDDCVCISVYGFIFLCLYVYVMDRLRIGVRTVILNFVV